MPFELLIFPLLGVVAGLIAGLLGVGGGIVIVPVLIFTFQLLQFSEQVLTHMAVGTSLATIIITSFGSVKQHHAKGAVRWDIFKSLAVGLAIGAFAGAEVADLLNGRILQILFGGFALLIAMQMALGLAPNARRGLPNQVGLMASGGVIGVASAVFGIGGGSLTVPFLTLCNVKMQEAVGTSSAGGMPIAIAGAIGFVLAGWGVQTLPSFSVGYIYLPALLGIGITSIIFSQVGAKLAHRLPATTLKRCFAVILVFVGIKLIIG
ncbi:MAG: sulfite exporter TauE/SafE family protein [Pseudomonadales bacterium]|nr:sulfite exporter TauE/SafE family protein [Pseudomonadales bacterium]